MHWLIFLAVFSILNASVLSWKSSHHGQLRCPSLQCLLLPSNISLPVTKQETTPSHEINTWYPIPKWRVFLDQKRSRKGFSQPYFNKQETRKTDGFIFENDFFSNQKNLFEGLNIKFLPLHDGYVAVKGLERKINDSAQEYAALFVVYVHSKVKSDAESVKITEKEMVHEKENGNVTCDRPDGCNFSISASFFNTGIPKNVSLSKDGKIISIPIFSNVSMEMEIPELGDNNYTVIIMPFQKLLNATEVRNYEMQSDAVNLTLSANTNLMIKSSEIIPLNKSLEKYNENVTEKMQKEINERSEHLFNISDVNFNNNSVESDNDNLTDNNLERLETTSYSNIDDGEISDSYTSLNGLKDYDFQHKSSSLKQKQDINYLINYTGFDVNTNLPIVNDNYSRKNFQERQLSNENSSETNYKKYNSSSGNNDNIKNDLIKHDYIRLLESYEIKALDPKKLPFVAKLEILISNKHNENKTNLIIRFETDKRNNSTLRHEKLSMKKFNNSNPIFKHNSTIKKRNINKEYFNISQNIFTKSGKDIFNHDEFISRENKINNKLFRSPNKTLLSKTEELSQAFRTMNYFPLIRPEENTERRNSSPDLFPNLKRPDSYSPATIPSSNEEFNKKNTYKSRNKGLIQNQILENPDGADSAKSNHIAYENGNKRGITLPTLIQNKDSRENHSILKKSELQIVERGSFDRHLSRWKRKISPGVMRLLKNDIKMSKICELGDSCKGINDVFGNMDESKYQRVREGKRENFDSKENLDVSPMYDYKFAKNKQNSSLFLKNFETNSSRYSRVTRNLATKQNNVWVYTQHLDSKQRFSLKSLYPFYLINENKVKFRGNKNYNFTLMKENASGKYKSDHFINGRNSNSNIKITENILHVDYLAKYINRTLANFSNSEIFFKDDLELHEKDPSLEKISRKKRSNSEFIPIFNYMDSTKQFNTKPLANKNSSLPINTQAKNKFSSISNNRSNFRDQMLMQSSQFMNPKTSRENSRNFNGHSLNSGMLENNFKSLGNNPSTWHPNAWHLNAWHVNAWHPNDQENGRILRNEFAPDYKWIIIVSDNEKHNIENPVITNIFQSPLNGENVNSKNDHPNPDREKEGNEWEYNDWILMNPVSDHPKDSYNPTPVTGKKKPWDIINVHTSNPIYPTIKKPDRKPVLQTTKQPTKIPFSYNPDRPIRYPQDRPTIQPWSNGGHWESNDWTILPNPWDNHPTIPTMMMMGNMAGGD